VVRRIRDARRSPALLIAIGATCISTSAVFVKLAHADAGATAFYRCAFAVPFLALAAFWEHRRVGSPDHECRLRAAISGVFFGLAAMLWVKAIYAVGAGVATVLGNLQVLFVALIAWLALREKPNLSLLAAVPIATVGAILISGVIDRTGVASVQGILYGLGNAATYAVFLMLLRSASRARLVAQPLAWATATAATTALIVGAAFRGLSLSQPVSALLWLLALALSGQTVGWLLISSSLPRQPAALSSLLLLIQPVAGLLLARVILSEEPSVLQLTGALLIIAAVAIAALNIAPRITGRGHAR
jgi:drug/metabolite transporter (DMT)-like permease